MDDAAMEKWVLYLPWSARAAIGVGFWVGVICVVVYFLRRLWRPDMSNKPIEARPGLRTDRSPSHPLTRALRELTQQQRLNGAVLLSIKDGRVGVNSCSPSEEFGAVMEKVADLILAKFDDGEFDSALPNDGVDPPHGDISSPVAARLRKMLYDVQERCLIGTGLLNEPPGTPRLTGVALVHFISETGFRLVDELEGVIR